MKRFYATTYTPKFPKLEAVERTPLVKPGSNAHASNVMNGARGTLLFPRGTFLRTVRQRVPVAAQALGAVVVLVGWPAFVAVGNKVWRDVPSRLATAAVQKTPEGYICNELPMVHKDAEEE